MNIFAALDEFLTQITTGLLEACAFVAFLWFIHLLNILSNHKISRLGIIPRFIPSLLFGPWCASFIHADINHLTHNSFPLLCLSALLFAKDITLGVSIILSIALIKCLMTWIFGRRGIHIGASGLIVGLFSYILYQGYYNPSMTQVFTAIIVIYYFAPLFFSIFPDKKFVSSEGHLAGMISGIIVGYYGPFAFLLPFSQEVGKVILQIVG